ncbi:hypothetical protein [Endozoicomonas acroporae]|uniref:hypothetical protein n=1 Tax=Endozoicomonas acroporae TaxID=1701104 RepID=UPI003D7972C2
MLIQPPTVPRGGTASDSRLATIPSTEPQGRWGSLDVSRESGVVPFLTRDGTQEDDNDKIKDAQQNSSQQHRKLTSTAPGSGHLPNAAALLGTLSGLAAVGLAASATRDSAPPIPVADAETLGNIGRNQSYPLDGTYRQTVPCIDGGQLQSIGNDTHPFTGIFHGENNTIGNLRHCLIKNLARGGRVDHQHFTNANITSTGPAAVVACKISENATISNIRVENAHVSTSGQKAYGGVVAGITEGKVDNAMAVNCTVQTSDWYASAGVGAGMVDGGTVADTTAVDCAIKTEKYYGGAGIGAGLVIDGTVANTIAVNCDVETGGRKAYAAIGVGHVLRGGNIANTRAENCTVVTTGSEASAGIGSGYAGIGSEQVKQDTTVKNTMAKNCTVETSDYKANAAIGAGNVVGGTVTNTKAVSCRTSTNGTYGATGIGAGVVRNGRVADTRALNCELKTFGGDGFAGIGAGHVFNGNVIDTTAVSCNVTTFGSFIDWGPNAGIGAGFIQKSSSVVARTTALNCTIETKDEHGGAGIGAGATYGTVAHSTSVGCRVITSGDDAYAAIGTGFVSGATVANTLAVKSNVTTNGSGANAGIGAGESVDSTVTNTTAVDSGIKAQSDEEATARIVSEHYQVCNTYLDNVLFNSPTCPLDDNVCEPVAHPLLLPDCQPNPKYLDQLGMSSSFSSDFFSVEIADADSTSSATLPTEMVPSTIIPVSETTSSATSSAAMAPSTTIPFSETASSATLSAAMAPSTATPAPETASSATLSTEMVPSTTIPVSETASSATLSTAIAPSTIIPVSKTASSETLSATMAPSTATPASDPPSSETLSATMAPSTSIADADPTSSATLSTVIAPSTVTPVPVKETTIRVAGKTITLAGPPFEPFTMAQPTVATPPFWDTTISGTTIPSSRAPASAPMTTAIALSTATVAPLASSLSAGAIIGIAAGAGLVLICFGGACIYRYSQRWSGTYRLMECNGLPGHRSVLPVPSEPVADTSELEAIPASRQRSQKAPAHGNRIKHTEV